MVRLLLCESADALDADSVWSAYDEVFGDFPDQDTWRAAVWDKHTARNGFRIATATEGELLHGFAYGYTGDRGQWWTDNALRVLSPEVAHTWLGGHFELVSIGVRRSARGTGIGRALMHTLLDGLPHQRSVLMTTSDVSDPARRLYASEGWQVLGPGIGERTVIMGRRLVADARRAPDAADPNRSSTSPT